MIHTTIGIYPDGSTKTNGVCSQNLAKHIHYNITYRPSRAIILDGYVIYEGNVASHVIRMIKKKYENVKALIDTEPYQ